MASSAENIRGGMFMVMGMAGFALNDILTKSVGESLNLGQTLMIRGIFATLLVFVFANLIGQWRNPAIIADRMVALRTAADLIATAAFVTAIFNMPIGNATAILQALPLTVTAAAALFLREAVGWRRAASILVGFIGVLIIVRPGLDGFTAYSLLVLICVAACTVRDLATRAIDKSLPNLMVTFATASAVALMGSVIALFQDWNTVSGLALLKLATASVCLIFGYYFVISAMRVGDVGFVAPYRYSILLFAIIAGYLVFAEVPDALTMAGSALVVASGVYTLYRERVVRHQRITPPPSR